MEWKKETLRSVWTLNKERIMFIFCAGLLLFVLSLPGDSDSVAAGSGGTEWMEKREMQTIGADAYTVESSYEETLESKVRSILSQVEGVGAVEVMIVLKSSEETVLRVDHTSVTFPELSGIIISADGGGSTVVKSEISEAMEALFGLPSHKIKVLKRVKKESVE